jgi:sugar transferase EpsL
MTLIMTSLSRETDERAALTSKAKRAFDIIVSGSALVALSPLVLLTAVLVAIGFGRPLFHRSYRAGLYGDAFLVFKFRTMTNAEDIHGNLLPDADRLTKLGRFLRALSLDELPQLVNIFRGEMSLVGPRPLPSIYIPRYSAAQRTRLEVRPGLTGLAQINGRNNQTWQKRLELDASYVAEWNFATDIKILWATVWTVLKRDGVSADGIATGHEFLGDGNLMIENEASRRQVA